MTFANSYTYTGGTQIDGGKLVCGGSVYTLADVTPFGAKPSTIDVNAGGTLDCNGKYNWTGYSINLNGGTITSGGQRNSTTLIFNAPITLTANSSFSLPSNKIYSLAGEIDLGNNTLSVSLSSLLHYMPTSIKDGSLDVTGTAAFQVEKDLDMLTVNLKIAAPINLQTFTLDVRDFETAVTPSGNGKIIVHGALKLVDKVAPVCTLANGATIDLSGVTALADLSKVALADGVTAIEVALGDTKPELGTPLANFGSALTGVTFSFKDDETEAVVTETGVLTYGTSTAPVATWTGNAGDGDITNEDNWKDNTLPTEDTPVVFSGKIGKLSFPVGCEFHCQYIYFENAMLTEEDNYEYNWQGLDLNKINELSVLDINGHTLKLCGSGDCTSTGMITDVVGGGEVHFEVAKDETFTNATLSFGGGLKFVKEGEGTFVAAKYPQTYLNKTIVKAGIIRCANDQNMNAQDRKSPFGDLRCVVLENGAFLDPAGSYLWGYHTIEMNGGCISNTIEQIGANTTAYNAGSFPKPFNPTLELSVDSTLVSTKNFNFNGVIIPNGKKLTVQTASEFRWAPVNVNGAEVEFTGGGYLVTLKNTTPKMDDISLVMNDFTFDVGCMMVVRDYTAKAGTLDPVRSKSSWHGVGGMTVSGIFTPTANKFFGCQMLNDSTINLSGKGSCWSTTTDSSYENGPLTVTFADNAKVTIDVHGRTFTDGDKVVSWTEDPTNLDGLTFELDAASKAAGYKIKKGVQGLYVWVDTGSEMTIDDIKGALPNGVKVGDETYNLNDMSVAEIKEILAAPADNGLTVNANILLGINQDEDGKFTKKPYLAADMSAQVDAGMIAFTIGNINPKTNKADIKFKILSATDTKAGDWSSESEDWVQITEGKATATATLPEVKDDDSTVKYFRVEFNINGK